MTITEWLITSTTPTELAVTIGTLVTALVGAVVTIRNAFTIRQNHVEQRASNLDLAERLLTIHAQGDGNITASMRLDYGATVRELAMMRELSELKKATGQAPIADAAIQALEIKLGALAQAIEIRQKREDDAKAERLKGSVLGN